jgi:hypothetical protein
MSWTINNVKYQRIETGSLHLNICNDNGDFLTLAVNAPIDHASWKEDDILVKLQNGETRQYLNTRNYLILPPSRSWKAFSFLNSIFGRFSHRLRGNINPASGDFRLTAPTGISQ